MSSPWAKLRPVEGPVSLMDITSEQLATRLQQREIDKCVDPTEQSANLQYHVESEDQVIGDADSDEVIAHMLQAEFNEEYNLMLKRTEEKFNRDSKVGVIYSNHRTCPIETEEAKKKSEDKKKDFDRFVSLEKEYASMPRCGYKKTGEGSAIITKHDMLMSSRINACRVLQFPPGIHTGDTGGFDVKLNNKVFNTLRAHSHAQCSRDKAKTRPHSK